MNSYPVNTSYFYDKITSILLSNVSLRYAGESSKIISKNDAKLVQSDINHGVFIFEVHDDSLAQQKCTVEVRFINDAIHYACNCESIMDTASTLWLH